MKRITTILAIILTTIIVGCGGSKQSNDDLIIVDVTKSYPKKELILQNILDVEYILLDDINDEFITHGRIAHIGNEILLGRNRNPAGDIFVFDKNGTGLKKINRQGQGPEEYLSMLNIILDEDNNEMLVYGISNGYKITVYDLSGTFKRSFANEKFLSPIFNFDWGHLLCGDDEFEFFDERQNRYMIISKQDGSVIKEIQIPYKEKKMRRIINSSGRTVFDGPGNQALIPNRDSWILTEISSDTIYQLLPDYRMIPFMIRTPSVQSMDPEVFLYPSVLTDQYYFMQIVEKTAIRTETEIIYPRRDVMYDRQEKSLFEYVVYNDDFSTKKQVSFAFEVISLGMPFFNNEIAFWRRLEAYELVDAYKNGELKDGKLKDLAATMNAESNPVIMVGKHKK